MKHQLTVKATKSYAAAPRAVQKAFDKQTGLLVKNIRQHSLRAKKYDETRGLWHARVINISRLS